MILSKREKGEMEKFLVTKGFLSWDINEDSETLKVWHILKEKDLIRF